MCYYDYATLDGALKHDQEYIYTVVATGVQSSRSTEDESSTSTDFILNGNDILGDSSSSIRLKANVPDVYTEVAVAENVSAKYADDKFNGGAVCISYSKPEYIDATVNFARKATGIDVDIYEYFGENASFTASTDGYLYVPAFGGTYEYTVSTSWKNGYYLSNHVTGEIIIPASTEKLPELTCTAAVDGVEATFTDTLGATYKLFRAENTSAGVYAFSEVTDPVIKTVAPGNKTYTYTDKGVVSGKDYIYVLSGTLEGAALSYNALAVKEITYAPVLNWNPGFAAFNNNGTVSLSWNNEDGITYTLMRKTVDPNGKTAYKEESIAITDAKTVNGVTFMQQKDVPRLASTGYYEYLLFGKNNDLGTAAKVSDKVTYNDSVFFDVVVTQGIDSDTSGKVDQVEFTVTCSKDFKISDFKFYRATVNIDDTSNLDTSAGAGVEFLTVYSEIFPEKTADTAVSNMKKYTYTDKTQNDDNLTKNVYVYAVSLTTLAGEKLSGSSYIDLR